MQLFHTQHPNIGEFLLTGTIQIFAINLVTGMLGLVYWESGIIPEHSDTALKVSTSGGTVIGQLVFGCLADIVGRKKMYGLELLIIIIATLAQSLTSGSYSTHIIGLLIFWRVIMGIGIGGDYSLSSIITSELVLASPSHKSRFKTNKLGAVDSQLQNGVEP